ncbi:MAG: hypothetical protein ACW96X_06230, partial [Promethearchaeota archaeon]
MPEEKEKVEDFISLWRKKMIDDPQKPGIVGETFDRMRKLDEENKKLRNKIAENIDLIGRTEDIVRKTIEENTRLKAEINQGSSTGANQINDLEKKNLDLSNRIKSLITSLKEKDHVISIKDNELGIKGNELNIKNNEITELNLKLNESKSALEFIASTTPEDNTEVSKDLIEELQSELSRKKSRVSELEGNIVELNAKMVNLNEQLIEKEKKSPVDYVIPVETPKPQVIKPQPAQTSSTLELLCQDLQADLNKYKRVIDNLTKEKSELKATLENSGFKLEPGEIVELKKENYALKTELSQLQETLHAKPKATPQSLSLVEAERLIEDLQEQLKLKDKLIIESKTSSQPQIITPKG